MNDEEPFTARVFINNGAVLISVPKVIVDSRDLKERIKEKEKLKKKNSKCFGNIILRLND